MTAVNVKFVMVNGHSLLNIRLLCYSVALLNLLVTAFVTLSIDLTVEEDPKVRAYAKLRWLLLTCWFNVLSIFYITLCLYCDWQDKHGDQKARLEQLRRIRDLTMNSILFPITVYSDLIFWVLYNSYPWIISPPRVLELVPYWAQHSLHTISMGFVVMDLVLTPRERPKSDKTNLAVMYGFVLIYSLAMYVSYIFGHNVYAFLETASRTVCIQSFLVSILIITACYYAQWLIVDCVWGRTSMKLKTKSS